MVIDVYALNKLRIINEEDVELLTSSLGEVTIVTSSDSAASDCRVEVDVSEHGCWPWIRHRIQQGSWSRRGGVRRRSWRLVATSLRTFTFME